MAEARDFSGLYRSDHFIMPDPPDEDSLECVVSLAYLAEISNERALSLSLTNCFHEKASFVKPTVASLTVLEGP